MDGWRANTSLRVHRYGNTTTALPPGCAAGSALGIFRVNGMDATARLKGVKVTVKGRNGTYGPVIGPLTVEIGLGGPAEQMGGQCGEQALGCTVSGTKVKCVFP